MLEPYDGKLSRTVLRREGGGNTADPADYSPLVNRLKGQVIKISPNSTQFINPMDINANYSEEDNPLSLKADFILSLCELVVGGKEGLLPVEKTVIDRCVHLIYRKYFADPCPENMPILEDLYNALLQQDEKEAHHVATALEIYVKGSLNLFNHRTNVNVNNRIVCYDIKELGKQMKKLGMLIVQDQVWGRVTANRSSGKSTRYYMDEMHLLLKEEQTAAYSVEIWKRFRKWGGIPTGLTQNVKDLLSSREVENIFENSDMIIMLNADQWKRYEIFQDTLGGRPYLFNGGLPPGGSDGSGTPGIDYQVPAEALTDEEFAAIYKEAQKYVGTPYVWGGSTPETGFDCSGYVYWVYNQNGYNVGRTTANGLWNKSQHISEAEAKPGDLVFFKGTYDTPGMSHTGIYLGNGMMVSAGDPIKYANIHSSYWEKHLAGFGRLSK